MRRVAVVGSGGAGKSTFSRELSQIVGLPLIHLDRHYWKPGWVETPVEEWRVLQSELIAGDFWIVDGNYNRTFDIRFARADTVIVLAISRYRCLLRALIRSTRNYGKCVQAEGCPERFDFSFYQWIWRFPMDGRSSINAALDAHGKSLNVIELTSSRQARSFLKSLRA